MNKTMPIAGYWDKKKWMRVPGFHIPWGMLLPHKEQAQRNHLQSLQRLAERGGLCAQEAILILEDKPLHPWKEMDEGEAREKLQQMVGEYEKRSNH